MISLFANDAAPGFDHPLQLLRACHAKILRQCDILQKLEAHLADKGCDTQVQQAATGILRYFDTAGQLHHQDEEEDLFPALRSISDLPLLDRLLAEHEAMLAAWDALRPALVQLAAGHGTNLDAAVTDAFITRYTGHIATENTALLPVAERILSSKQLMQIGRSMSRRRGATEVS
ncbi:MAG: hemerythrin domain-containing protein [Gallionella sp.]|nr:hemerythrin domain-containing protein [Gallionella sp.]